MTIFSCNKLNLFLTHFQLKAFDKRKRIAQVLQRNFCKFFADCKSKAQELSNDVSFVIFGHQKWDLEGGGQIALPPPAYPGFQVPQQG